VLGRHREARETTGSVSQLTLPEDSGSLPPTASPRPDGEAKRVPSRALDDKTPVALPPAKAW